MSQIELEDGKYTYINDDQGQRALRYGEPWRDLAGDKFVYCLAAEIEAIRAENEALKQQVEQGKREAVPEDIRKDAERWRDLVSHQVFNNKPQVGYAINRTKERITAAPKQEK